MPCRFRDGAGIRGILRFAQDDRLSKSESASLLSSRNLAIANIPHVGFLVDPIL